MTFETAYATIIASCPALVSIIGNIISMIKMIKAQQEKYEELSKKFEELRIEVITSRKEYDELKRQLLTANQENRALRRKINEVLTKMDHIKREEDL